MTAKAPQDPWVPGDTFAHRLILMRRELNLNQRDAAQRCGIKHATWGTWENGTIPPHLSAIGAQIARVLNVDAEWLVNGGPLATVTDIEAARVDRRRHRRGGTITRAFLSHSVGHLRLRRVAA